MIANDERNSEGLAGRIDGNDPVGPTAATEPPPYRSPRLLRVGKVAQIQGRNYNDNKDKGNDNYYI